MRFPPSIVKEVNDAYEEVLARHGESLEFDEVIEVILEEYDFSESTVRKIIEQSKIDPIQYMTRTSDSPVIYTWIPLQSLDDILRNGWEAKSNVIGGTGSIKDTVDWMEHLYESFPSALVFSFDGIDCPQGEFVIAEIDVQSYSVFEQSNTELPDELCVNTDYIPPSKISIVSSIRFD